LTNGDSLSHSISEKALENSRLKKRISELENDLSPKPVFVEILSIVLVVEPDYLPDSEVFVFSRVYTP
jgi:hypothetical protein